MVQGYNAFVMRSLTAMALCGALQMGAFQAPFVHAHLDDHHDDHHGSQTVHAHFGGHGHHADVISVAGTAAIDAHTDPEQTTRLQIFVAVPATALVVPALPPARFTLAAPIESFMRQALDVVRSHGPPALDRTSPRAPPIPSV